MTFHIIASTGRTATTYIAARLNEGDGIAATHEGYLGSDKSSAPLLPLINLENRQAFQSPEAAEKTVSEKRSDDVIETALEKTGAETLIDVAYYNPMIASALLQAHPTMRVIGILRDCESFVRSATTITGEDPMPVGWPDADKSLSDRERFIAMGRIRPGRGDEAYEAWKDWSAIRKNIWLWEATNRRLIDAANSAPDRVRLIGFEALKQDPNAFWSALANHLGIARPPVEPSSPQSDSFRNVKMGAFRNAKAGGYQIGPSSEWTEDEQDALQEATDAIRRTANLKRAA
ncbi:MAG: hypothetical protein AAGF15_08290 [Pseudomonadota bacterium]